MQKELRHCRRPMRRPPYRRVRHLSAGLTLACAALLPAVALAATVSAREVSAQAFPDAAPSSVGIDPAALEALADRVQSYLDQDQIVGAELLVIKDRTTVLHRVFGHRDREADVEMTPETIFNIRSMTKPLTGAAVQMLIDDGLVALPDPVSKHLPGFDGDGSREITVEQLLTHRGGLPVTVLSRIDQYEDLQAMAAAVGARGPQHEPGSQFWYSDPGTDVLGALVEKVSAMPLHEFWRERLFEPLGMRDSFVPLDPDDERWPRLASSYIGRAGSWHPFWTPDKGPLYPFAWGSQTVYSTPRDYARFLALWMDGGVVAGSDRRILSSEAVERTLTPVSEATGMGTTRRMPTGFEGLEAFYGQLAVLWAPSLDAEPEVVGHSGSDGTFAWAWPDRDLMVLYFTQSRGGTSGLALERWIDELLVNPRSEGAGDAAGREELETLYAEIAGEYEADFGGLRDTVVRVFLAAGRPVIDLGRGRIVELRDPDPEGLWRFALDDRTALSFDRDASGRIVALRVNEGSWRFEAPRVGVEIEAGQDLESLRRYVGTYRIEEMDADIEVVIQNGRLTLDKSNLPVKTPADRFELLPPDEEGRWVYRINERLSASFAEGEDGTVEVLNVYEGDALAAIGRRSEREDSLLPELGELMELRDAAASAARVARLGRRPARGEVARTQARHHGQDHCSFVGRDRSRTEMQLGGGGIVEVLGPDGAALRRFDDVETHSGAALDQARTNQPLFLFADWREVFSEVEVVGRERIAEREAWIVRGVLGEAPPIEYAVDAETGDVLRSETVLVTRVGELPMVTSYGDFRDVGPADGGLRLPHRITSRTRLGGEVIVQLEEIATGQELAPSLFELDSEGAPRARPE